MQDLAILIGGIIALVVGVMLFIAPLMIWNGISKLREEEEERFTKLLAALSSLQKSIERLGGGEG